MWTYPLHTFEQFSQKPLVSKSTWLIYFTIEILRKFDEVSFLNYIISMPKQIWYLWCLQIPILYPSWLYVKYHNLLAFVSSLFLVCYLHSSKDNQLDHSFGLFAFDNMFAISRWIESENKKHHSSWSQALWEEPWGCQFWWDIRWFEAIFEV